MRTTLTIDDDLALQIKRENRKASETMKQTINRLLSVGIHQVAKPPKMKRFVVKPLDLGITAEQWAKWEGMKIEDILDEAERTYPG